MLSPESSKSRAAAGAPIRTRRWAAWGRMTAEPVRAWRMNVSIFSTSWAARVARALSWVAASSGRHDQRADEREGAEDHGDRRAPVRAEWEPAAAAALSAAAPWW